MTQSIPYAIEQACLHVERVASVIEPDRASYLAVHMIANVIDYVNPDDLTVDVADAMAKLLAACGPDGDPHVVTPSKLERDWKRGNATIASALEKKLSKPDR